MRGFVCVLVCVAAFAAHAQAQFGGGPGGPGGGAGGGTGGGAGGGGGAGAICPGHPDPNAPLTIPNLENGPGRCMPRWTEYEGHCYLYDSGSLEPRATPTSPYIMNAAEGIEQPLANLACVALHPNASLVTVNNQRESDFLYDWAVGVMVEPLPVWIGLHAHPVSPNSLIHEWQWYSGEPVNFTNWAMPVTAAPGVGFGALLFDADIPLTVPNQIEISAKWIVEEQAPLEPYAMICEYSLNGSSVVYTPPATEPATTMAATTAGMAQATTQAVNTPPAPATSTGPVMLNNPANLRGGRPMFGGSRLHEVPRRQRNGPANFRMGPYYAVQP